MSTIEQVQMLTRISMAVDLFNKVERKKRNIEKMEAELDEMRGNMNEEEWTNYFQVTEQILEENDVKHG